MFESEGKNLIFKDSTKCLQEVPSGQSFKDFLGQEYYDAVTSLKQCSTSVSGGFRPGRFLCIFGGDDWRSNWLLTYTTPDHPVDW